MHYVAIDLHKRYSVVSALNEQGRRVAEARIDGNSAAGFEMRQPTQAGKTKAKTLS